MKTVSMSGSLRKSVGKKDTKAIRREGKIPCVLYGGAKQIHFTLPEIAFKPLIFSPDLNFVEIEVDGEKFQSILQDIQYHPVSDKVMHADFLELNEKKMITIDVPIKINGVSPGVLKGGKLDIKLRKLKIKGLPFNIPQYIDLDISSLDITDRIRVCDLSFENIEILSGQTSVVIWIKPTRGSVAAAAEATEE